MSNADLDSASWWRARRWPYNRALLISGVVAFACYVAVFEKRCGNQPDAEITLFTTAFQGLGYLGAMGVANLCFNLGRWSERIVRPRRVGRYRTATYQLGLWFSVLLPFSIPLVVWLRGCGE